MLRRRQAKHTSYQRGLWAENIAAIYLFLKGYRVLERRYKTAVGEVDLIVTPFNMIRLVLPHIGTHKNQIIFVEVKYRRDEVQALESITAPMRRRIEKAALTYMTKHHKEGCAMRFDVIVMGKPFFIRHLDNAWMAGA